MKITRDIEQGKDEWHALRLGVITASKFKDVLAEGKGKTRASYMRGLAADVLTGQKSGSFADQYMEWGTETEPQARAMYQLREGVTVEEVTFIKHDSINAGVSPDGLVGDNGLIEIKCPKTETQIVTYLSGKMPTTHKAQVQGQIWISEREWCDFLSFDPRINGVSSYFKIRIERDDSYIDELEKAVRTFDNELNEMIDKLR